MKKIITIAFVLVSLILPLTPTAAWAAPGHVTQNHVSAILKPVNGSGVEGFVDLRQQKVGTQITLIGFGLQAGHNYVSLYYGNHKCNLEPYSADDVIGGIYTANRVGVGVTHGRATDNLDEINSVSIRDAETFNLLACANVHP